MKELHIVTIKPLDNVIEYGIRDSVSLNWDLHGVQVSTSMESSTTGAELIAIAMGHARANYPDKYPLADAQAQGWTGS